MDNRARMAKGCKRVRKGKWKKYFQMLSACTHMYTGCSKLRGIFFSVCLFAYFFERFTIYHFTLLDSEANSIFKVFPEALKTKMVKK